MPLVIQAVENRKTATYGNWIITKPGSGRLYVANRESDTKSVSAPTVKELIPLMNAEDFASPRNAATKTIDLRPHLKPNSKGEYPHVDTLSAGQVDFDTPDLSDLRANHILLFSSSSYSSAALLAFPHAFQDPFVLSCFIIPMAVLVVFSEWLCVHYRRNPYAVLLSLPALCVEIFLLFQLDSGHANEFIYFAF